MSVIPHDEDARRTLVEAIHAREVRLVAYVTGGGIAALTDLLTTPGASQTVLDVRVPYSSAALAELIGSSDEDTGAVSGATAAVMATAAYDAALGFNSTNPVIGVSCTAALTTNRTRRGHDRAHIAVRGSDGIETTMVGPEHFALATTRLEQDRVVADHLLAAVARGCGLGHGGSASL